MKGESILNCSQIDILWKTPRPERVGHSERRETAILGESFHIALLGKIRVEQVEVNQPIVASQDSYKPTLFRGG
jgi:hypothetical protein